MITLKRSILETIAWAQPRIDKKNLRWSLRSQELRPDANFYSPQNPSFFNDPSYIHQVVHKRNSLLASLTDEGSLYGKMMLVDFECTNANESTEIETRGFFDSRDNPPWDLWVGVFKNELLVWVPPDLVDLFEQAEAVECMGIFQWIAIDDLPLETIVSW